MHLFPFNFPISLLAEFSLIDNSDDAFIRERRMKKWKRNWKLKLIEKHNPNWEDLAKDWD